MKLRTKLFHITDALGNDIDLDGLSVILILNGQPTETKLEDVITDMEIEENEIYGNSLLSYYTPQEGKLVVQGSIIELAIEGGNQRILVNAITRPGVNDDTIIPFEHIQKFAEFFQVAKPDEVFTDMNEDEKHFFIDARLKAAETQTASAAASSAELAAQKEAELKASIHPDFIAHKKDYKVLQNYYADSEGEEYIKDPYHLFYSKESTSNPDLLIKRGADWFEAVQDVAIIEENDKTVVIEFNEGEKAMLITLDIEKKSITISEA